MSQATFTLPYPPTVNHYYTVARGRKILSQQGRDYRDAVGEALLEQRALAFGSVPVEVWIDVYPPDRRRRDLDNLLKGVLDSLTHNGVFDDDSQVVELSIKRMEPLDGKIVVRVTAA